ncbi:putative NRPS-like protein biosynthetic cluster [Recurvomyces mirabilis]|uniref:NRPS-like protein biosynthetic cluster n=1 Tax=Recurvomyces mirabilis TaxID=574656 RepID=A0AAE1C4B8_9PEZI|nr:putative NRPS-like protein biosynthetic cluster [Recurvomyces mirabilis]KAK5157446.1 hypothetical protein LTS14_004211 [Recurvomyces mirabilis]
MEPNYFTCTLGQAAALGIQQDHKTITGLVDYLAKDHGDLPAVGFPQPGNRPGDPWTNLLFTFGDIARGSERVASALLQNSKQHGTKLLKSQTVGLLCPSTPDFLFTWLALIRLGHAVLLIAPQCQPIAIANLCQTCEVSLLFYDDVYKDLAQESSTVAKGSLQVASLPFSSITQLESLEKIGVEDLPARQAASEEDVAYLHHTSGTSSGMPKPIPQTHRAGCGVLPSFHDGREAATFTTTPLYHGGIADLFRAWTSRAPIWLFPGKKVPITAFNIVKCLDLAASVHLESQVAPVKYFSSVPYVLQMMEGDNRGLRYLQSMDIVGVGGAALPPEVGDRLVNEGVNLISRFGSAECGFLLSSHREYEKDNEWQYLRVASGAEKYLKFESQAADDDQALSELVVLPSWPHMAKRNREDGSLATSDLFAAHPTILNAWRYHSRADSQLTLVTGKKFDPAPLEASLATSELLEDVLIFGTGRPYPGALLFRSEKAKDLDDGRLLDQLKSEVEKLNNGSQDHARIPVAMLVPMPVLQQPLEKSSKGTLLRGAVEKRFAENIETAYVQADDGNDLGDVPDDRLPEVLRTIITGVKRKGKDLKDDTDLFSYGIDSVAGMQIRGKLRRLLPPDAKALPINVVEDCGNVERLAGYIRARRRGDAESSMSSIEQDRELMKQLVRDEAGRFIQPGEKDDAVVMNGEWRRPHGDVVVLTGATGALGAHVLDQYRQKDSVSRIYCLVRGVDEHAASERVNKALIARKLRPLDHDNKITILRARLGDPKLGLDDQTYRTLAREATTIMHIAWSVNFRMRLRSFVPDNIRGVTSLLNLALSSPNKTPPRFGFCSSVASAMAWTDSDPVPETIIARPDVATELGYSQSKWVAEQICQRAVVRTRMRGRVCIYRVGQLAGDSVHGVWNAKEAWPMMLNAVKITGTLPDLGEEEKLDWLPVDSAARALIEGVGIMVRETKESQAVVYHILNENTTPNWSEMLAWLKETETFDIVTPAEWVKKLESAVNAGSTHPASQLLDFWRKAYLERTGVEAKEVQAMKVSFDLSRTKEELGCMRAVEPVGREYFGRLWGWIGREM